MAHLASIPSPSQAEIHLGPIPLRAYALCIILGVVASVIIGERRFRRMGYAPGVVGDIAIWAVPFGLVGARLYHVITDNQLYFRKGENPWRAFAIWDGGLGIWGGIALGAVGAIIGCRQYKVRFAHLADAMAPGIPVAQAIGRFGNFFNQELYGKPSGLPWAVRIDPAHRLPKYADVATYQPTFLYESIWDVGTALFVVLAERFGWFGRLSMGRAFALYVAVYTVGRGWIEYLRIDEAHRFLGLRLNDYTSLILFLLAVGYMVRVRGREPDVAAVDADEVDADEPESTEVGLLATDPEADVDHELAHVTAADPSDPSGAARAPARAEPDSSPGAADDAPAPAAADPTNPPAATTGSADPSGPTRVPARAEPDDSSVPDEAPATAAPAPATAAPADPVANVPAPVETPAAPTPDVPDEDLSPLDRLRRANQNR